jgi:hypothetical protein
MSHPDPVWHRNISFGKSALRILAGFVLCFDAYISAGVLIILAEVLGIVEELV